MAFSWNKGYSSSYYMSIVDSTTWRDSGEFKITSGSINRMTDGLRESASIVCDYNSNDIEMWIRIYMIASQEGNESVRIPMFTGLATTPNKDIEGAMVSSSLECYSVLKAADDVGLLRGWFVSAGSNSGEVLRELLSVIPAPVVIGDGTPTIENNIVSEDGETRLTMVDTILSLMDGWRLKVDGEGTVFIEQDAYEESYMFDPTGYDIIEPKIKMAADWFSIPNVFCAIEDATSAIARNDDINSPLSVDNRGREVWMIESVGGLTEEESIEEYAKRRLQEEQRLMTSVSYTRRYIPDLFPSDLVLLNYPEQGIVGSYYILNQSVDLGYSASTSEEVVLYGI